MINFVSQESLAEFIENRLKPCDDDESPSTPWKLAGDIIKFTKDQEQAHRDLQQLLCEKGQIEAAYKAKIRNLDTKIMQLQVRIINSD